MKNAIRSRRRRGAAITEFAIVLPLFLLLVFGIIEFGRMMIVLEIVTNAAREGARRAVVAGATDAQAFQTIDDYLAKSAISGFTRQIADAGGNPTTIAAVNSGDPINVTVSVPYSEVDWGIMFFLSDNQLSATATMRKE